VLDPYRLVIAFIALIHIVLSKSVIASNDFVFVLKMIQDKCSRSCNRDYFQCNRERNRSHCAFLYS